MFTVKANHPDVPYSFAPITGATDSEGSSIPASEFEQTPLVSDNTSAVDVERNLIVFGKPNSDGSPAIANLVSEIKYQGNTVAVRQYSFTVTHGDPVQIVGGGASFEGLTEDQEAAPVPEPATEGGEPVPEPVEAAPGTESAPAEEVSAEGTETAPEAGTIETDESEEAVPA